MENIILDRYIVSLRFQFEQTFSNYVYSKTTKRSNYVMRYSTSLIKDNMWLKFLNSKCINKEKIDRVYNKFNYRPKDQNGNNS